MSEHATDRPGPAARPASSETLATATSTSRRGCNARCPRCGGAFDCGVADASPCGCRQAVLTQAHRAAIATRYSGCLCLDCLTAIVEGATP